MATKHMKLHEHGVGPKVVSAAELAKLKDSPSFNRVYREEGPATEAEVAAYNNQSREAGKPVEPESKTPVAQPTGTKLPQTQAAPGTEKKV